MLVRSPDADLAGDLETTRSKSGLWIELQSADGKRCCPIAWRSKRQGSTASSTCEAETISMATALKSEALPLPGLFSEALGRTVMLECRENNSQCISVVKTGYSAALRHLPRKERIAVGVVGGTLSPDNCRIVYQESSLHKGDVFTKWLAPALLESAIERWGLRRPSESSHKGDPGPQPSNVTAGFQTTRVAPASSSTSSPPTSDSPSSRTSEC